jgi:hypothetical protein
MATQRRVIPPFLRQLGSDPLAQLYLADEGDEIGGAGAFFLLLDDPEVYGLPPDPVDTW